MDIINKLPAEVVCAVVKELTGESLDFSSDLQRQEGVKILVEQLNSSDEMIHLISQYIEKYYVEFLSETSEFPKAEFMYVDLPADFHDELEDDIATRADGRSKNKFGLKYMVTPEELGFSGHEVKKTGPDLSVAQWEEFLLLAEKTVGRLKSNRRQELKHKYIFTLSCEKIAHNYELVTIEHDSIVRTAKFLFNSKWVYVVIESDKNKHKETKWVGEMGKVEHFSEGIVKLFNGESESANLALASVRGSLNY